MTRHQTTAVVLAAAVFFVVGAMLVTSYFLG